MFTSVKRMLSAVTAAVLCVTGMSFPAQQPAPVQAYDSMMPLNMQFPNVFMEYADRKSGSYYGGQWFGAGKIPSGPHYYDAEASTSGYLPNMLQNNLLFIGNTMFNGGVYCNDRMTLNFQSPGEGLTVYGDLVSLNGIEVFVDPAFSPTASAEEKYRYTDIPYIYVDGTLKCSRMLAPPRYDGSSDLRGFGPVNIYAGAMTMTMDAAFVNKGDLYLYNPDLDSDLRGRGFRQMCTELPVEQVGVEYSRGNGDVLLASMHLGSVYCNNRSLTIGDENELSVIEGDLVYTNPNGVLKIAGGLTVHGSIICAGSLIIQTNRNVTVDGNIYADPKTTAGVEQSNVAVMEPGAPFYNQQWMTLLPADRTQAAEEIRHLLYGDEGVLVPYYDAMFPFEARKENMLEQYILWDYGFDTDAAAMDAIREDPGLYAAQAQEEQVWGTTAVETQEGGTRYYPVLLDSRLRRELLPLRIPIPSGMPLNADQRAYYQDGMENIRVISDAMEFEQVSPGNLISIDAGTPTLFSDVTFFSYDFQNEKSAQIDLHQVPVISESCILGATSLRSSTNENVVFIDPTQYGYDAGNPMMIELDLEGYDSNRPLTLIVNNNNRYAASGAGMDYTSPVQDPDNPEPTVGQNVWIFLKGDPTIQNYILMTLKILTTGAYQMMMAEEEVPIIGNPVYQDLDSLSGIERHANELVPNVMLFGQKDYDYSFQILQLNANVQMPESSIHVEMPNRNYSAVLYRNHPESVPYPPERSSGIDILGSVAAKDYLHRNPGQIVGLPDRNRPIAEPKVTRQGMCGAEGDNLVYMFDETAGILDIAGNGEMAEAAALEWQNDPMFAEAIRYVNLPDGLEALPANAFANCINLEGEMILPASVEAIGKDAFTGCSKLSTLRIENPLCLIDEPGLDSGTVIMGYRNSTAQAYAAANDYVFVAIDPEETTESTPSVTTVTSTTKAPVTTTTTTISSETTKSTAKSTETTTTVSTTAKPVTTTTTTVSTAKPVTTTTTTVSTAKPVTSTTTTMAPTTSKSVITTITTAPTTTKPVTTTITTVSTTKKPVTTTTTTASTTAKPVTTTTTTVSTTTKPVTAKTTTVSTTTKPVTTTTTTLTSRTTVSTVTTTVTKLKPPVLTTVSGTCGDEGDNVTWELKLGRLLITGKGKMQNYTLYDDTPWADYRDQIENIEINEGVTNVGSYAFKGCTELESLSLPKTCTRIGGHAFSGCKRLAEFDFPQQMTMLDSYAFDGCTKLESVTLPDSLTRIDGWAFRNTALESVTVPKNVASIGNDAFSGCSKLKTITILNPECKIADSEHTIPESAVISGLSGSTAQQYAENYKREFVRLDTETTVSAQTTVTTVTTARTSETTRSESTAKTDSAKETTVTTTTTVTVKTVTTTTPAPTDTQKSSVTTTSTTISTQTTAKTNAPVNTDTTESVPASATSGTTDTTASETAAPTVPGTTDTHTTAQSTSSERTSGTTASSETSGTSAMSGTSGTSGTSTGTTDTVLTDTQTGTMLTEAPTTSQKTDTTPADTVTTETTKKTAPSSGSTGETTANTTESTETTPSSASEKQETTTVTTISTAQSVQSGSSSKSTAKTTTTTISESTASVPTKTTASASETTVSAKTETEPVSATDDTVDTTESTAETTLPTETELTETDTTDSEITDTETTESETVTQDTATEPESTEPQETTTVTMVSASFEVGLLKQLNCHSQETRTFTEIGLSSYYELKVRGGFYAMGEDGQYLDADGNSVDAPVMLETWEYDVLDWFSINEKRDTPEKIWNKQIDGHNHECYICLEASRGDFLSREEGGELPEGVTDILFKDADVMEYDIPFYIGMLGDYNLDDQIRADDAQRALRSYVDSALIGTEFKLLAAADNPDERYRTSLVQYLVGAVNDDGKLDAADAQLILSYYIEHLAGHTDRTFTDVRQPDVTLSNSKLMLNTEGDSRTYQLTLYYDGADTPVWSSSDPVIATVSDDGLVTAKTDGIALITVRTARGTAYCQVIVGNAEQYPADSD